MSYPINQPECFDTRIHFDKFPGMWFNKKGFDEKDETEAKRILYLRRRALLMELALIEDELGIERSVKRK